MPTPNDLVKLAKVGSAADKALFNAGVRDGRQQIRKVVLDYLEKEYMALQGVARETPEGRAILVLTRALSEEIKKAER